MSTEGRGAAEGGEGTEGRNAREGVAAAPATDGQHRFAARCLCGCDPALNEDERWISVEWCGREVWSWRGERGRRNALQLVRLLFLPLSKLPTRPPCPVPPRTSTHVCKG